MLHHFKKLLYKLFSFQHLTHSFNCVDCFTLLNFKMRLHEKESTAILNFLDAKNKGPHYAVDAVKGVEYNEDDFIPEPLILHNENREYLVSINRVLHKVFGIVRT